jgi:gas vesicle protein
MSDHQEGASAGSVALAFMTGVLLGATTAFLFAPHAGRDSRERLLRAARQTGEGFREFSDKATGSWEEAWDRGRDFVQEASTVVRDAVDAGREAMQPEREEDVREPYSPQ